MKRYLEMLIKGWFGEDKKDTLALGLAYLGILLLTILFLGGVQQ